MQSHPMQSDPLLTQDELDFIQKIVSKPAQKRRTNVAPQLTLGEQLNELLARLGGEEQLSLDTHTDQQHLSFPLHLIQDGHSQSRLELGAPLIFEQGVSERPWRLVLPMALTLLDSSDRPSGLKALELSNNGMRVKYSKSGTPAKDQLLQLLLPQGQRVQLRAQLVRRVGQTHYAYTLQTLHAEDEQTLRQYLFEQHSELHLQTAAVG
ncbi:PilZ domain-containing protein [Ectopseudomonas composti]|uniref:PilZ domain-containing protein n=1 Tax=Ectopseudomonas composti TaxID=658457 RepID=UPI000AC1B0DB|nr:PilZ domain-containing protein [Pseudomonas composti]